MGAMLRRALVVCACLLAQLPLQAEFVWESLPDLPQPMSGHFAGVHQDALIVAGGSWFPVSLFDGGEKVWLDTTYYLELGGASWEAGPSLAHPLAYGAFASTASGVLCAGGTDGTTAFTDAFYLAKTRAGLEILPLPPLPEPVMMCGAALLDNTFYVAGGQDDPASTTARNNLFALNLDAETLAWEKLDPIPGPARILPAVASQGGALYVISGADLHAGADGKAQRTYLTDAYKYTPGNGWQQIADVPRATVAAAAASFGDNHVFVFSGDDGALVDQIQQLGDSHPGFPASILGYHVITNTWADWGEIAPAYVTTGAVAYRRTNESGETANGIVIPAGEDRPGHRGAQVLWGHPKSPIPSFGWVNYATLFLYFAVLVAMGFYFSRREGDTRDFFLGGRRVPWWAAGISIFGTLLSSITFLAVPATAFATNWVYLVGNFTVLAVAPIVVYLFLPFYRRLDVVSAYEYLERRFNRAVRLYGSGAFVVFQLGRVGIVMLLPSLALSTTTGINVYYAIVIMGVLCTIYTYLGGIEAVIWTDVIQVFVLFGGALLAFGIIIMDLDNGWGDFLSIGASDSKFRMFNWSWDYTMQAAWVVVIGRTLENIIPYTSDQTIVQRYLTTSSEKTARQSIWLGTLMALPSSLVFFGLGTALYVFYKENPVLLDPALKNDGILALFITQQLPVGISGLVIAALFAAAMSSLDSSLNSVSAVVVSDWIRPLKPNWNESSALLVARLLTLLVGVFGTLAAVLLAYLDLPSLWEQYMKIIGLFMSGLTGLFLLGIFAPWVRGPGALAGAVLSAVVLYIVQVNTPVSFLLYSTIGIVACVLIGMTVGGIISAVVPARDPERIRGLTWYTLSSLKRDE